ncbi:DUF2235 domain-containing protein [Pseudonocardia acaciae]|uniref:DUF2235 domain-containing protein n=1 Tax=Pseudonocardia acaciae TaxID=551276 RepID=UPI00048E6E11|nr:DUF2235 domain-containing protein [Pseudonocardia acaciae]
MRHLVVCCDGTWNTPGQTLDGVPTPTNVVRLYHALERDDDQLGYYHPGVGTGPTLVDRLAGGGLGVGVSATIKSAYSWLATHYRDGDAICLFGFSRGAYTVRSLSGMLSACGLASFPEDMAPSERWHEIDRLYDKVYRPARGQPAQSPPYPPPPIRFLGVWDTVGALGIPDQLGLLNLLDIDGRHRFHNTTLSPQVEHARHAVALDEARGPFTPTLWTGIGESRPGTVRQVWFPGDHCDVGGGHRQTGLSDCALRWMIDEAEAYAKLRFRPGMKDQVEPDPLDVLHDSCTGLFRYLGPAPRPIPLVTTGDAVADSALDRQARPLLAVGPYRPGRTLAVGDHAGLDVYAARMWNDAGLYLEPGRYEFVASGEWLGAGTALGPAGTSGVDLGPSGLLRLASSLAGWWQERLRGWSHNETATFLAAPRSERAPWMALLGTVADQRFDSNGALQPHRSFVIGDRAEHTVERAGYLYAYANSAWGLYSHNRGAVHLTVTRLG